MKVFSQDNKAGNVNSLDNGLFNTGTVIDNKAV